MNSPIDTVFPLNGPDDRAGCRVSPSLQADFSSLLRLLLP